MEDNNTKAAISFRHVTKTYKLYKDDKQRFRAIFFKNVKCKQRKAINDVSFDVMPRKRWHSSDATAPESPHC